MGKEKILVIGASGQIGVELTLALRKIHALQQQLEKRHCHELEYMDDPQFFISGIPSGMDEYDRNKLKQGLQTI
jgi:hypothetical protein